MRVFSKSALDNALAARSMSPSELARRMGISEVEVSRWRTGRTVPRAASVRRMADALGEVPVLAVDLMSDPESAP
ncbi:MAG: helix-turn-helix transcriptional regulator [Chloroflexi bacterium]|nr:MAG: helix-turn-helix transcriptional regulator [Chloroflexota bacterium]